jgi:organic radical activating enzyme
VTLFVDVNGNYEDIHGDKIHSQQLNKLKNWYCTAGLRHLYIDFDGTVWRGTCEQDGALGNVFRPGMIFNDRKEIWRTWTVCKKEICACGADFNCPKVKSIAFLPDIQDTSYWDDLSLNFPELKNNRQTKNPQLIMDSFAKEAKTIAWDLGRRCNYNCSYCPISVHNNFETHKSLDSLLLAEKNINDHWRYDERIKWTFTGGEPTTNKDLIPFLQFLYNKGDALHVQTNGSRTTDYYKKLFEISSIGISVHLEFADSNHILKLTEELSKIENNEVLEIRIMLKQGMLKDVKELYDNLKIYKNHRINVNVDLLHNMEDKTITAYQEKELEWLKNLS